MQKNDKFHCTCNNMLYAPNFNYLEGKIIYFLWKKIKSPFPTLIKLCLSCDTETLAHRLKLETFEMKRNCNPPKCAIIRYN